MKNCPISAEGSNEVDFAVVGVVWGGKVMEFVPRQGFGDGGVVGESGHWRW